ncbi:MULTISPECIES: glycogen synthase GlgA [Terrabacteria group]|uniref:glycogen synthase GlgA n=1 Tax=Bacillati TaxID=1783272 RepID=UPI0021042041|nr:MULTISPECIES: glycogen synthase GlgA [Terrabacteria group]
MKRDVRVLFASYEATPFLQIGGLGDVAGSLPLALKENNCDVRVILPKVSAIPSEYVEKMNHICEFQVPLGWRQQYCGIEELKYKGLTWYFVDNEYYFKRDGVYGYFDDGERIAFFAKAVVEAIQYLDFEPDVLHCNDWHTALSPVFLREFYRGVEKYDRIKTVFTVHNLKFQGQMSDYVLGDVLGLADIPAAASQLRSDKDSINFMKGALSYSDVLTTVSPSYANEIQSMEYGEHLEAIFQRRNSILHGILNGIDTSVYNPKKDFWLVKNYDEKDLRAKAECKKALQEEVGLEVNADKPLVAIISRLTRQKGLDLVVNKLSEFMKHDIQLLVLGTGDKDYEDTLKYYALESNGKISAQIRFDEGLAHHAYAGADMMLLPSLFEPCGLTQMIAQAYGTLPIVRETGGLKDSVVPYNQFTGDGDGFSFANFNAEEMFGTILNAVDVYYNHKEEWIKLMKQAMEKDHSWRSSAKRYADIYYGLCPELSRVEEVKKKVVKEKKVERPKKKIVLKKRK